MTVVLVTIILVCSVELDGTAKLATLALKVGL